MTWQEMIDLLASWNVQFVERDARDGEGKVHRMQYFEHRMDGETLVHAVDVVDRQERLLPSVVRQLCLALRINPTLFGLELG